MTNSSKKRIFQNTRVLELIKNYNMKLQKIIEIKNLTITKKEKPILTNIDIEVKADEHYAIIGPNGAGKSFLLGVLSADIVPNFGSKVKILDKEFGKYPLHEIRKQIGFVSNRQIYFYDEKLTTFEIICSGFFGFYGVPEKINKEQEEIVKQKIIEFGLKNKADLPINLLSDGERRKALLAKSLVNDPKILILDEPAIGLDIKSREKFLETIEEVTKDKTLIYVTHHLEELPKKITNILYLKNGKIFNQGLKEEMLKSDILSSLLDYKVEIINRKDRYFVISN